MPSRHYWKQYRENKKMKVNGYLGNTHLDSHSESRLIEAIANAVKHVHAILRRDRHLNCRSERVGLFIPALRRELSGCLKHLVKELCDTRTWEDAGVMHNHTNQYSRFGKYAEVAMTKVPKDGDIENSLHEIQSLLNQQNSLAQESNNTSNEADKVVEGLSKLIASM